MPDGDVDRKMERISEEQAVEWRAEYDKDLADVGRPTFALPAPTRPTRLARLPADPGAKAPSRPATPAPAEGDELDEEPPVEVPTFHFVGCYSAAEGCATDASVVEVRASSNVVRKHGLGALPPPPAEGEGAPRPPQLASWALPAAATASAVAVDARRGADEHAVLALGLATGAVLLWDLHLDLCRRVLKRHQAPVTSIAVHRHKYLVAGAGDGRLHVYDLAVPGEARAASGAFVATEPALVACRADLAAPVTKAPRSDGDHAVAAGDDCVVATSAADGRVHVFAAHHLILQLCPGVNAAAGGESDPLTILRLFSNPDGGPGDFAAEPPPSPPPGTAKPLWVLREHDGAEECFKVMWSDRSHMMVDEDEVKDCDLVARAAAAQDVDDVDGPQNLEPLNQGLRLLEHASARVVKVKEERDDEREEKEDAQELTGHLVVSENAKMSEIDALKKEVAQKARRIAELEATSKEKDLRIVELEKSNRKKDQEIASLSSATSKGSTAANEPRSSKVKTKAPVKTKTVAKATAPAKTKTTGKAAETKNWSECSTFVDMFADNL
ncbi:hypothetical protein JL721_6526 [Aureococcus anophagefferens]|nr:hypothetical protein JL721_6526 [Aureococcus anophagefferens]